MADPPSSPATVAHNQPDNPNPNPDSNQSDPVPASSTSTPPPPPPPPPPPSSTPSTITENPNPNNPALLTTQTPSISSYSPPPISGGAVAPPMAPSFRPAPPQFSLLPTPQNLAYQNTLNPGVQPPGVSHGPVMVPGVASGVVSATVSVSPMMTYQVSPGQPPNPAMRPYMTLPNGYAAMSVPLPQGTLPPPGVLRYPSPYGTMVRPAFSPRPPGAMGMLGVLPRPPFPGMPGIRPFTPPVVRPFVLPTVTPAEKPQTTVYVGKIAPTVENDFMLSLLRLCGPVKSWKRAQDPSDGTPKGFGFCEFESAEGVLRVLRLLSKFNIDGQELVLNVNQATREYLERYVEKKTENSKKLKETEVEGVEKEGKSAPGDGTNESPNPSEEDSKKDDIDSGNKESQDTANFGIVTDEDKEADHEALEKLTSMIEERLKTKPLPPPPPPPPVQSSSDITGNSKSELPSKEGDPDVDLMRNNAANDMNDEDTASENKPVNDHDRPETGSPNRSRRYDRSRERDRDRDRERGLKREKEREFEKLEREAQRERERKERERDRKVQDAERAEREYKERVKEWESREREKERQRQTEKEREKERERKRKKEINDDESDDDDDSRKRMRRSVIEEKRRKRLREKEDDLDDRLKEEEEIVEAQRRAVEEQDKRRRKQQQQQEDALKLLSGHVTNQSEDEVAEEINVERIDMAVEQVDEDDSGHINHIGDEILQNGMSDDSTMGSTPLSDMRLSSNAPARKLGFGIVGSGKRTAVPSVFTVEEDDVQTDKKMRPLVPIDYSNEELQVVQPSNAGATPLNLAAAAQFAKCISNVNPKEEKRDAERERSRRSYDKSGQQDRDRSFEDTNRHNDEIREKNINRERGPDKLKTPDNKKLLDAKQLIDMIPKTQDEIFSYEINWAVYDEHELHERMRPWISKKITEFLGEEEHTLVDYIVSSTQEHVKASQMLELLQSILDDEAEMFVLKMWRMLIFEIKKVETGLALMSKP